MKLQNNIISALYITRGENQKGIKYIFVSSFYTGKSIVIHELIITNWNQYTKSDQTMVTF